MPNPFVPQAHAQDPSGVPRQLEPGRAQRAANNSGIIVGESKTVESTGDAEYKTEFVKVYQDAGVVGVAMLTLLALCLLLGLFCSRLIKMYTALTESRDTLEAARTVAIEKLTSSMILLRGETNVVVAELRREHQLNVDRLQHLATSQERYGDRAQRAYELLEDVNDVARTIPDYIRQLRERNERIEQLLQRLNRGDS